MKSLLTPEMGTNTVMLELFFNDISIAYVKLIVYKLLYMLYYISQAFIFVLAFKLMIKKHTGKM